MNYAWWRGREPETFLSENWTHPVRAAALASFERVAGDRRGLSVCEVGPGGGRDYETLFRPLVQSGRIGRYSMVEGCDRFAESLSRRFPEAEVLHAGLEAVAGRRFGVVYAKDVLEHQPGADAPLRLMLGVADEAVIVSWFRPPGAEDAIRFVPALGVHDNVYARGPLQRTVAECGFALADRRPEGTAELWELRRTTWAPVLVPRVFHQFWFGPPMPPEYHVYRESWMRRHPDWEWRMWTERNLPEGLRHRALADQTDVPSWKTDILRYEVVSLFGGVYLDTDFECFKPIDRLVAGLPAFAAQQYPDAEKPGAVACGFFGATPGHPWMRDLLDGVPARWDPGRCSLGPWYFTDVTRLHPEVVVFPRPLFYPYGSWEKERRAGPFPGAYAAHHWAGSWVAAEAEARGREAAAGRPA